MFRVSFWYIVFLILFFCNTPEYLQIEGGKNNVENKKKNNLKGI